MARLGLLVAIVLLLFAGRGLTQEVLGTLELDEECSMFGEELPESVRLYGSEADAEGAISRILGVYGLSKNFIVRAAGVPNAAAAIRGADRYILYDPYFMQSVQSQTGSEWGALSIMAHEIGHHVNGHTLRAGGSRPDTELEADYFSGFALARMGSTLDEARLAMSKLGSPQGSDTHPARHDRLAAIARGWRAANQSGPGRPTAGGQERTTTTGGDDPRAPPVPIPTSQGLPAGSVMTQCGCWGFAQAGQTAPNPQCASGVVVALPCQGFCPTGGSPWGTVCR